MATKFKKTLSGWQPHQVNQKMNPPPSCGFS